MSPALNLFGTGLLMLMTLSLDFQDLGSVSQSHAQRRFEQVEGRAVDVGVGSDGEVWVVNQSRQIYRWSGKGWIQIAGSLKEIAVGSKHQVWGLSPKLGRIFHRRKKNGKPGWFRYGKKEGFRALDVSASGDLWLISKTGDVFRRVRGKLKQMPGEKMSRIAVGSGSNVWAVNDYEQVFSWSAKENKWKLRKGKAVDVGVGSDGVVYIVDDKGQAHRWVGKRFKNGESLNLKRISVGKGSHIWATGAKSSIWQRIDLGNRTWHYVRSRGPALAQFLNALQPRHDGLRVISATHTGDHRLHVWARKDMAGTEWKHVTKNRYFLKSSRPELNAGQLAIAGYQFQDKDRISKYSKHKDTVFNAVLENRAGRPIDAANGPHKWHYMEFVRKLIKKNPSWKSEMEDFINRFGPSDASGIQGAYRILSEDLKVFHLWVREDNVQSRFCVQVSKGKVAHPDSKSSYQEMKKLTNAIRKGNIAPIALSKSYRMWYAKRGCK